MAVKNSISNKPAQNTGVEYESGGQTVKLSPNMIRNYLVSGGGEVTDSEVMMFLSLCKFQGLNPFLKEAHLIKFGDRPATMVVGKDVFTKRARRNPDYSGKYAGIIVQIKETGEIIEREGTFYIPEEEKLVGGWAKVFIKGYDVPEYAAVSFNEYAGRKSNGELNQQWASKPATMIRKVALVHALREAFPEEMSGMYAPEEIPAANAVLDESTEPIPVPAEMPAQPVFAAEMPAPPIPPVPTSASDVSEALFG
ncbi:MAG: phage recombination protein Bet [Bacteroidaceae bacterium]|nr:phage recombination protein Bet [Bacteroidaceae bacterium]